MGAFKSAIKKLKLESCPYKTRQAFQILLFVKKVYFICVFGFLLTAWEIEKNITNLFQARLFVLGENGRFHWF